MLWFSQASQQRSKKQKVDSFETPVKLESLKPNLDIDFKKAKSVSLIYVYIIYIYILLQILGHLSFLSYYCTVKSTNSIAGGYAQSN